MTVKISENLEKFLGKMTEHEVENFLEARKKKESLSPSPKNQVMPQSALQLAVGRSNTARAA